MQLGEVQVDLDVKEMCVICLRTKKRQKKHAERSRIDSVREKDSERKTRKAVTETVRYDSLIGRRY